MIGAPSKLSSNGVDQATSTPAFDAANGTTRVRGHSFSFGATTVLERRALMHVIRRLAATPGALPEPVRAEWQVLDAALRDHPDRHRDVGVACLHVRVVVGTIAERRSYEERRHRRQLVQLSCHLQLCQVIHLPRSHRHRRHLFCLYQTML